MVEIVFMIGYPGSGKSTYIAENYPNHVRISSDKFIEEYAKNNGGSYQDVFNEYIGTATKKMFEEFQESVKSKKDMVIDRTNMNNKSRNKFINQLPKLYDIKNVVFEISLNTLLNRNKERKKYGRQVPACIFISPIKLPENYIGVTNG